MIHKYQVFELEMFALKNWFKALTPPGDTRDYNALRDHFVRSYINSPLFETVQFNQEPKPSTRQKIMYLNSLGLTSRQIQKYASASPNTIQKVLREDKPFIKPNNPQFDSLIESWQRVRRHLPDEIFYKYL